MMMPASLYAVLGWLVDVTLKGSIVILVIATVQMTVGRRSSARWRHALWLLVVLRMVIPFAPSSRFSMFNLLPVEHHTAQMRFSVPSPGREAILMRMDRFAPEVQILRISGGPAVLRWLVGIWLTGLSLLTMRMLIASIRTRRAVQRARRRSVPDPYLEGLLREATNHVSAPRWITRMHIFESELVQTPALHGLIEPALLFPTGMTRSFTREELRNVILHELWHVRRFDIAINWLLSVVQAVHWFNPFVWFATSRIKEERELACDELALSCLEQEERLSYGTTILKLLERFRMAEAAPAWVGIVNNKQKMKRRLMMIASYKNRTRFSIVFAGMLGVVSIVALTDAHGGEHRMMVHELDPAMRATHEKLHQRVSLDVSNVTFGELLNSLASRTGVVVTQSPDLATSNVQQARFTVKAENVPAHAVLMESLMAFELGIEPSANGVTITKEPSHGMRMKHMEHAMPNPPEGAHVERIIVEADGKEAAEHHREGEVTCERSAANHPGMHEMSIRHITKGPQKLDASGKLHRDVTINIEENGVKSEGKLTIDISAPPEAH